MNYILFLFFFIPYLLILGYSINKIVFQGKYQYVIFFIIGFLPYYHTLLTTTYQATRFLPLISIIKSSKEIVIFLGVIVCILSKKDFFQRKFSLIFLDKLFVIYTIFNFVYVILPIGSADFINKIVYFKNIFFVTLIYFIGRNSQLDNKELKTLLYFVLFLTLLAFSLNLYEKYTDTHFQTLTGYGIYEDEVLKEDPTGHYGLSWTFETASGVKRFASFYTNPLDTATICNFCFCVAMILAYFTKKKKNKFFFGAFMLMAFLSLYFTFSRASLISFALMFCFILYIFKKYNWLWLILLIIVLEIIYLLYFSSQQTQDFMWDTIYFRNPSSFGHLYHWLVGFNSMLQNPWGIGLATSGVSKSVEEKLMVGGENQFIITGVQIGFLGVFIYILMLAVAISTCFKVFRKKTINTHIRIVAFIACSVKFALLLPAMTSNTEVYMFVIFTSWWAVGYANKKFNNNYEDFKI